MSVCVRFSRLEILMRRVNAIKNERLGKREYITDVSETAAAPRLSLYTTLYFDAV